MNIEYLTYGGTELADVSGIEKVIVDAASALELAMTARYETGTSRLAISKETICEDFFILSTGLAGEILQKFTSYPIKLAVYGDYSKYTSKPLKDFIYESNQGSNFFFTSDKEEAIQKLTETQ